MTKAAEIEASNVSRAWIERVDSTVCTRLSSCAHSRIMFLTFVFIQTPRNFQESIAMSSTNSLTTELSSGFPLLHLEGIDDLAHIVLQLCQDDTFAAASLQLILSL